MDRINGAGHVGHLFVTEDPAANRPPTEVTALWLNGIQEELASFIEWAGLVLASGDNTQVRQALLAKFALLDSPIFTGNPRGPTRAQFDNSTSFATSAFVQRALGNLSGQNNYAVNTTLTSFDVGCLVTAQGGTTMTLPVAAGMINGSLILILGQGSGNVTVQAQGADSVFRADGSTGSVIIPAGSLMVFRKASGGTGWVIDQADAALKYSPQFSASVGANGSHKFPSGAILQWGFVAAGSMTNGSVITLPTTYPANHLWHSWDGAFQPNYTSGGTLQGTYGLSAKALGNFTIGITGSGLNGKSWWSIGN